MTTSDRHGSVTAARDYSRTLAVPRTSGTALLPTWRQQRPVARAGAHSLPRQGAGATLPRMERPGPPGRWIVWLTAATAACYAIGYPVALLGHSVAGWVLVFLGGPLLLTLGVLVVRWLHGSTATPRPAPDGRGAPPQA
jgi:hypothetical protein